MFIDPWYQAAEKYDKIDDFPEGFFTQIYEAMLHLSNSDAAIEEKKVLFCSRSTGETTYIYFLETEHHGEGLYLHSFPKSLQFFWVCPRLSHFQWRLHTVHSHAQTGHQIR